MEVQFKLQIEPAPGTSSEGKDELCRQLQSDLRELDAEVSRVSEATAAPSGSKGIGPADVSTLLVTLAASGGVFTTLINAVQSWSARHGDHGVTLEMDGDKLSVTGISASDQQRIIDQWLNRHSKPPSGHE
jgi:hypothetical protein